MAMLAEPRRKQKFSSDPRNLNWSQDDTRFGKKLMEKMGWQAGKGLGANEDGKTEHIKVSLKSDTMGVGCTKDYADNWVAHQDEFNALLSSLNSNVVGETKTSVQNNEETKSVQNLEEVSKSSKGRLHYKKFTRGKDLTNAKREDLNCIFGRRGSKSAPSTPQSQSETNTDEDGSDTETTRHGITTIRSSTSVQDYFKAKLAAMKAKALGSSISAPASANQSCDEEEKEPGSVIVEDGTAVDEVKTKKRKKSKKKSKHAGDEIDEAQLNDESEDNIQIRKSKKAKKQKKKKEQEVHSDQQTDTYEDQPAEPKPKREDSAEFSSKSIGKKSKNKEKPQLLDDIVEVSENFAKAERTESKASKRKRQPSLNDEDEIAHDSDNFPLSIGKESASIDQGPGHNKDDDETLKEKGKQSKKRKRSSKKLSKNASKYFKGSNLGNVQGYGR